MNYRFLCSNISMFTPFSFIMPVDYYARNIFMLGNRRPSTFLYSFFLGHQHFYTQACRFLCSKTFLCLYPYVSMLVSLYLYARNFFYMIVSLCFYALANLWTKKFKKNIYNGSQIVHKNVRNLVVETVFELDLWLKNYSEKTKIKR